MPAAQSKPAWALEMCEAWESEMATNMTADHEKRLRSSMKHGRRSRGTGRGGLRGRGRGRGRKSGSVRRPPNRSGATSALSAKPTSTAVKALAPAPLSCRGRLLRLAIGAVTGFGSALTGTSGLCCHVRPWRHARVVTPSLSLESSYRQPTMQPSPPALLRVGRWEAGREGVKACGRIHWVPARWRRPEPIRGALVAACSFHPRGRSGDIAADPADASPG